MSVPLSHKNIGLSKADLLELFLQYEKEKLTLKRLSQYLSLGERQAKRRFQRWKKDGTLFPKRGYGCKIPYSPSEFLELVVLFYNNPNTHPDHVKNYSKSTILRHSRHMTYPSKCYLLSYIPPDVMVLSFEILGKRIKDSNLHLVVTIIINTANHTVNYKNVRIENDPLSLCCDNTPEYNGFINLLFKNMSCTYFQQLKMRRVDKMDDFSCLNVYTEYYNKILSSIKDNELYQAINSISNTVIDRKTILASPSDSLYMLKSIVYDRNFKEDEDTNKFECDIHSKSLTKCFNINNTNWYHNNITNECIKSYSYSSEQDFLKILKKNLSKDVNHCNNRILPSDPQYGELTVLVSESL